MRKNQLASFLKDEQNLDGGTNSQHQEFKTHETT